IIRLIIDGIIGSIGSIFVFVPQLMILFFFLSLLEDSGYMSRIAFIMDRVFRQIGLSGKSFIPMLIGTGCSIPGVMASRGIENKADREMTILLTPFIPCGAKLPVYAMFLSMMFPKQGWLGPVIYIMPFVVVVIVGYLMKLIRGSGGNLSPFIIELPEYKLPHYHSVLVHMWDKAKEFVKRAGSIIFVAVTILWLLQSFDFQLNYVDDISVSMLAQIGNYLKVIFVPLGFGDFWAASVAALAGTVAKEVVVTTFASIGQTTDIIFTQVSAFSFIIFVSFSAPCVAAMSTMYKELGSLKKTLMAIGFQTGIAYTLSLIFYQTASRIFAGTVAMNPVVLDFGNFEGLPENGIIFSQMGFFIVGLFVLLGAYVLVVNILIKRKLMRGIVS
ncbi:MAG: ferrous iron transporter B, partial [Erysipelothrix sp.]|nr:ferrous iron transporter B [Erysipelothrix sp.]